MGQVNPEAMTVPEFASALGVTRQTVYNWLKNDGLPVSGDGHGKTISFKAAFDWARSQGVRGAVKPVKFAPSVDVIEPEESYEDALSRKTRAEADLKELQLARERGQVASIADVEKVLSASTLATQTQILAVPSRLATRMLGIADHAQAVSILDSEMRQLLTNLADIDAIKEVASSANEAGA